MIKIEVVAELVHEGAGIFAEDDEVVATLLSLAPGEAVEHVVSVGKPVAAIVDAIGATATAGAVLVAPRYTADRIMKDQAPRRREMLGLDLVEIRRAVAVGVPRQLRDVRAAGKIGQWNLIAATEVVSHETVGILAIDLAVAAVVDAIDARAEDRAVFYGTIEGGFDKAAGVDPYPDAGLAVGIVSASGADRRRCESFLDGADGRLPGQAPGQPVVFDEDVLMIWSGAKRRQIEYQGTRTIGDARSFPGVEQAVAVGVGRGSRRRDFQRFEANAAVATEEIRMGEDPFGFGIHPQRNGILAPRFQRPGDRPLAPAG